MTSEKSRGNDRFTTFAEVATFRSGRRREPDSGASGAHPIVGSNGIIGYCDESLYDGPAAVIGRVGANCGSVQFAPGNFWATDNTIVALPRDGVYARWLFYALSAAGLTRARIGAAQPLLTQALVGEHQVWLPDEDEQWRIAGLLGALDDKIEHNRKLADTATRLLELIFVQECTALGEGHRESTLTAIADFVNGGAFTKHANATGRPIIRIKELNDGVGESTPRTDYEVKVENIACHHDLLFSWSGSLDVYRWFGPEAVINQHIFKVIPRDGHPAWFIEGWLKQHLPDFQAIASEKATTMGHIQRHHLDEAVVLLPGPRALAELDAMLGPLDRLRGSLRRESRHLAATLDSLLPKLVSGQIRVPESYDPDDVLWTVVKQASTA